MVLFVDLDSGKGMDQHQVAAVAVSKGNRSVIKYWDPNGVPAKRSPLFTKVHDTTLCLDRNEFFHDAKQVRSFSSETLSMIIISPDRSTWKYARSNGPKPPPKANPRMYSALNSTSPEADIRNLDDNLGGCSVWVLIFAVTMGIYTRRPQGRGLGYGLSVAAAVKKWTAMQKNLHKLFRIHHNWAVQLVRGDLLRAGALDPKELELTIASIVDNPTAPEKWDSAELRKNRATTPAKKRAFFDKKRVWSVALDAVYGTSVSSPPATCSRPKQDSPVRRPLDLSLCTKGNGSNPHAPTRVQLVDACRELGLAVSGPKMTLCQRLKKSTQFKK